MTQHTVDPPTLVVSRGPLTYGQLSVWRSVADLPPDRATSANLQRAWPLPAGVTVAGVRRALDALEDRHESLRTGYVRRGEPGADIEQVVWPAAGVEARTVTGRPPASVAATLASTPFALDHERPMRVAVVVRAGVPTHLALCVHHMAADGAGLDVLHHELQQLLAGVALDGPAPRCRDIAREQRESKAARSRGQAALGHWQRALAAAGPPAPRDGDGRGEVHWTRLRSRPGLEAAREVAARTGTSVHSVVLAAYCRALLARSGAARLLVGVIAGNRNDDRGRALVSTLNQLVPLVVEEVPGEPFDDRVRRLHRGVLLAYRHGCFDVDAVARLPEAAGYDGVGTGIRYFFNFMPGTAPAAGAPAADGEAWTVRTTTQGRDNGFGVYLKGGDGEVLDVSLRQRHDDPSATEAFVLSIHDQLHAAAGERGGEAS